MKQISAILLGIAIATAPLTAGEYVKTINFDSETVSVTNEEVDGVMYSVVRYGELLSGAESGSPSLPRAYVSIALPPNISNLRVTTIASNTDGIRTIEYPIIPATAPVPDGSTIESEYIQNPAIYASDEAYPSKIARIVSLKDHYGINSIVALELTPVQISPASGSLAVYDDITFKLSYDSDESAQTDFMWAKMNSKEREWAYDIISRDVINPEDVDKNRYLDSGIMPFSMTSRLDAIDGIEVFEYSIITTRALKNAFERLAALKRQLGLDAGVICIEDVLACPRVQNGDTISNINDDAGKLRQFLLNCAYFTHLKYCLLGGKYPLIPIRYGTPGYDDRDGKVFNEIEDQYHVPTDWYFAELSRNWNVDGDVFYGEFTEENIEDGFERLYSADLFLGRLPCLTVEEVNNYINKLEIYLMNPGFGDTSYLSAAHSHFSDTSLRSNIIPKPTLSANQYIEMSYSTHDIYEQTEHVSGAFVLSSIVDKKYGFVDFHGHGNPFSIQVSDKRNYPSAKISVIDALDDWHKYGPVEENNGLDKLDNFGYPNIMYVNSCNTAPMDSPNYCGYGTLYDNYHDVPMTLSESFLLGKNYGGVAYIGNTRTGYNDETPQLEAAFFKNFWRSGVYSEIGRLFNQSNWSTNSNRNGLDYIARAGYYVRLSRNLFGDPQLMIWRGEPTKLTEFYVSRGDKNLNVGWSGDYGGASGCEYVVVEPDGSVHRGYLGTNLGRVSNVSSNSTVTVIKDNMIPYICDLSLQNIRFKERSYVYCKDAVLGKAIRKFSQGNVEFRIGSDYTIDATGDVALKNGTIVRYGAILHIFTPGCCTLDSAIIESGAIIDIHAPQIINYIPDVDLKNDNRFIIHGYDKYGMGRAPVEIINKGNILKSRGKSDDYRPMLEVGKEWRYALVDCAAFADEFEPDLKRVYRIDGIENIDGKDYYVMNTYTGDALTPDGNTPYGYFREDRAEKKVYFLDNFDYDAAPMRTEYIRAKRWKEEEFEIYDFASAPSGYVETELNVCENVYRGFTYESEALDETNPRDGYFEGLGWTPIPDERLNRHGMFDILGYCSVPMGEGASYFPFLYEIAAADGTILYRYDPNLPASLETAVEDPDINAPTEYFTLQGVKVAGEPSSPGIYLRKTGNTVTKVIVK